MNRACQFPTILYGVNGFFPLDRPTKDRGYQTFADPLVDSYDLSSGSFIRRHDRIFWKEFLQPQAELTGFQAPLITDHQDRDTPLSRKLYLGCTYRINANKLEVQFLVLQITPYFLGKRACGISEKSNWSLGEAH
jgi:hypothetical protein